MFERATRRHTPKAASALLVATLVGCAGLNQEARYTGLPPNTKVTAILALRADRVLVAGHAVPGGALWPITAREPRIYTFDRGPAVLAWGEGTGWIVDADHLGDEVWAVRARLRPEGEGSLYDLLVSRDAGASWDDRGPVPATSLTSIAVAGDGVGWAHGAYNLWRTEDRGATWTPVEAPGTRDSARERLVATGPRVALLAGPALLRTEDGGATWRTVTADPVHVTDGRFVVGPVEGGLRVGRLAADGVRWGTRSAGPLLAAQIASDGNRVTVLASEAGEAPGRGAVLLRSADGGTTIDAERVTGPLDPAFYTLVGPGGLAFVDLGRTLRVRAAAP